MAASYIHRTKPGRATTNARASLFSGQMLNALAGLALVKAVAIYVPPSEWGIYSLALSTMTLGHALLVGPVLQSLKVAQAKDGWLAVLPFYRRVLLCIYALVLVAALGLGIWAGHVGMALLVWLAAAGQGTYSLSSEFMNLSGRFKTFSVIQASYGLVNLAFFGGVVVLGGRANADGLWLVLVLLNGLFAISTSLLMRKHLGRLNAPTTSVPSAELLARLRRFATPLLALAVASWLINYADRYLISYLLTTADVGIYSIGYGIGAKMLLLVGPFIIHLSSRLYQLRGNGGSGLAAWHLQRRYLLPYASVGLLACLVFYLGQNWIGSLVLSEQYRAAFAIGPIVAAGYLCLTLINLLEIKWYAYSQTKYLLIHTTVGAIVNISLNLLLIPVMGLIGAALATLLGYLTQLLLVSWLYRCSLHN